MFFFIIIAPERWRFFRLPTSKNHFILTTQSSHCDYAIRKTIIHSYRQLQLRTFISVPLFFPHNVRLFTVSLSCRAPRATHSQAPAHSYTASSSHHAHDIHSSHSLTYITQIPTETCTYSAVPPTIHPPTLGIHNISQMRFANAGVCVRVSPRHHHRRRGRRRRRQQ